MTDQPQTPAEILAHVGPSGPVAPAFALLRAMLDGDGDFAAAWDLMDDQLHLCRAQAWLWNNRTSRGVADGDLDELASDLSAAEPTHPLWPTFAAIELAQFRDVHSELDIAGLGAGSRPRPIGVDLEVVILMPTYGTVRRFDGPTIVTDALAFTMRSTPAGWRVAGYSDHAAQPGWPPSL